MRAMAELGPGPHRSGDIAAALGVKVTSVGFVRKELTRKGMYMARSTAIVPSPGLASLRGIV
jgi:hypothetical protein